MKLKRILVATVGFFLLSISGCQSRSTESSLTSKSDQKVQLEKFELAFQNLTSRTNALIPILKGIKTENWYSDISSDIKQIESAMSYITKEKKTFHKTWHKKARFCMKLNTLKNQESHILNKLRYVSDELVDDAEPLVRPFGHAVDDLRLAANCPLI